MWPGGAPVLVGAPALYARLRSAAPFAGSELNVEGALVVPHPAGPRLRLLNRGNGAPRNGRRPVNATADLDLAALLAHLAAPDAAAPPLLDVTPYALGTLGGLPLGLTDGSRDASGRLLVTMAAEDSPDATRDGRVSGSALGVVDGAGGPCASAGPPSARLAGTRSPGRSRASHPTPCGRTSSTSSWTTTTRPGRPPFVSPSSPAPGEGVRTGRCRWRTHSRRPPPPRRQPCPARGRSVGPIRSERGRQTDQGGGDVPALA